MEDMVWCDVSSGQSGWRIEKCPEMYSLLPENVHTYAYPGKGNFELYPLPRRKQPGLAGTHGKPVLQIPNLHAIEHDNFYANLKLPFYLFTG